jgi:hypothetical protein
MKKSYVLLLAIAVSFAAMSFKPATKTEENLSTKISTKNVDSKQIVKSKKEAIVPLAVVAVALAETSYAATVVATAAAYNWLFGNSQEMKLAGDYKAILQNIDMRSLDNSSK